MVDSIDKDGADHSTVGALNTDVVAAHGGSGAAPEHRRDASPRSGTYEAV